MRRLILLTVFFWMAQFAGAQQGIVEYPNGRISAEVGSRIKECLSVQEKSNWCWAACVQAVLRFKGSSNTQRSIVKQVLGKLDNEKIGAQTLVFGLNNWEANGIVVTAAEESPIDMRRIVKAISSNQPLIVGMDTGSQNHAMILVGIEFAKDATREGKINPIRAILLDPSKQSAPLVSMGWKRFFNRVGMVLNVDINTNLH